MSMRLRGDDPEFDHQLSIWQAAEWARRARRIESIDLIPYDLSRFGDDDDCPVRCWRRYLLHGSCRVEGNKIHESMN